MSKNEKEYGRQKVSQQIVLYGKYIDDSRSKEEVIGELENLKIYIERVLRVGIYLEK